VVAWWMIGFANLLSRCVSCIAQTSVELMMWWSRALLLGVDWVFLWFKVGDLWRRPFVLIVASVIVFLLEFLCWGILASPVVGV